MRILIHGLQAGNRSGTGCYTRELVEALCRYDHAPEVVCLWPKDVAAPAPEMESHLIRYSPAFASRFFRERCCGPRLAKRYAADVVHFPASIAGGVAGTPVVLTVHDLCYKSHPEWFSRSRVLYYNMFMGPGICRATRILADSQATADDIVHFYGIPESRIDVVPLGVNALFKPAPDAQCAQLRAKYGLPAAFFLFVGTLEPRKNLERVIKAWASLGDSVPDLVIAGRTGWKTAWPRWTDSVGKRMANLHCLDHVPQELLPVLYSAATVFVWPSLMEGFGLPPLEAMACGTPVITSNSSSLPEVAGDAALLVDPHDTDTIAEAMAALGGDTGLRQSLRTRGRERAALFTWDNTAKLTMAAYRKACDEA